MSLLYVLSRLILAYLVFGISISMPHSSSLLAFLCLLRWRYMWHIDVDVLGIVWGFEQSSITICPVFPIPRRNVVFFYATSQLEINQRVPNHVSTCTAEGVLPTPWLETLHTTFVELSLQMETIECDIQIMRRGCSVFVSFFSFSFFFLCYSFLCRLTIMTMFIYIVA